MPCEPCPKFNLAHTRVTKANNRVMFLREYKIIDSAVSVDKLRRRLKNEELEQYGDAFTPEFVYDAIKQLPRFASMQVCLISFSKMI